MSRQNKVNPGKYTQAGRLSQDDAAREMMRQRASIASRNHHDAGPPPWETSQPAAPVRDEDEGDTQAAVEPAPKPAKRAAKSRRRTVATKARAAKSAAKSPAKSRRPVRKAALARSVVKKPAAKKPAAAKKTATAKRRPSTRRTR